MERESYHSSMYLGAGDTPAYSNPEMSLKVEDDSNAE
jgi:hypothetical protein